MTRTRISIPIIVAFFAAISLLPPAISYAQGIQQPLEWFTEGFDKPVAITHAGDSRLFVVEQTGKILIVQPGGETNPVPFLNLAGKIVVDDEQGLLGIAFHPQYAENGFFYVNYIGRGDSSRISRFRVSNENPDVADSLSEFRVLTIYQPYENHNGGHLAFGPDNLLYIGLGDGGRGGDPENRSQNPKTMLGKMIRIDVDADLPYGVPQSNPFVADTSYLPEIWALGLRNPWKYSFDRLTGDLWIADVGQGEREELNLQPAASTGGENYGWRCYEGNLPYNTTDCMSENNYVFPAFDYPHGPECSVTGGYVYRGNEQSPYYGKYFFADFCSDKIWTLTKESDEWSSELIGQYEDNNFSTFGEDASGELYIAGFSSGNIYRFSSPVTRVNEESAVFSLTYDKPNQMIRLQFEDNPDKPSELKVFDLNGTLLINQKATGRQAGISSGPLPTGVYLLQVTQQQLSQVQKFIVD